MQAHPRRPLVIERESNPDGTDVAVRRRDALTIARKRTVAPRPTYRQDWPAYNAAQIHEKDKFQTLLAELCRGVPEPPRQEPKGGRPPVPMADRVFACAFKVYTTDLGPTGLDRHAGRPGQGASLAAAALQRGLPVPGRPGDDADPHGPDRRERQAAPVDRSRFRRRFIGIRHVPVRPVVRPQVRGRQARIRLGQGERHAPGRTTNVVTAVEIDERYAADCPKFAPLLKATAKEFTIREVSADAAYLTYENMELVASHRRDALHRVQEQHDRERGRDAGQDVPPLQLEPG